ncbi:hypothetical protein HanXRQr2_Chr16g0770171 [Helianthus annuus]|uniref:Uncharacterized protein n=1 Tax=Helianthus annuus TaxID=4232 RepID=A0A9K3GZN6_HELAN|nr:hypothetical protein HanXRQr2_Chr16g0770151 [Helianthus annuus]KAF5761877.1 hypothetical protein HanXRQr2_Chr16g0770171 [Helianthus annuus]KAJ0822968.1 hypothetical protein HanPSC8_Chr16g0738221 [Helianthus annuus]KAJ0822971.1 hypothetical protein HanPSC8_Chr16g0738251 [Helianthus annuus]
MSIGMKQLAVFWGLIEVANRQFQLIYMKLVSSDSICLMMGQRGS